MVSNEASMAGRYRKRYRASRYKGYGRSRSYYRRRYYRNKYRYRRYNRRYRRRKVEYKRVEHEAMHSFGLLTVNVAENTVDNPIADADKVYGTCVAPFYYGCSIIGYDNANASIAKFIPFTPIKQGTAKNERIGAKINPVKLRIYGTITIVPRDTVPNTGPSNLPNFNSSPYNQTVFLRMLVFQVRTGNANEVPHNYAFSAYNPYVSSVTSVQFYNSTSVREAYGNFYNEDAWLNKFFETRIPIRTSQSTQAVNGVNFTGIFHTITPTEVPDYARVLKSPLAAGIAPYIRILKDKIYSINPTTRSSVAFRFKTKKPLRMVWLEKNDIVDVVYKTPRNPIYIVVIPVFPYANYPSLVNVSYQSDMFYTDS